MKNPLFHHIRVTVIDGAGCGEAQNRREQYPLDSDVNSILHASQALPFTAPALQSLGLGNIAGLEGVQFEGKEKITVCGAYGSLTPSHIGNGSPEGHQALMGYNVQKPYLYFDKAGFPKDIVQLVEKTVRSILNREVTVVRYPGTDDINGVRFINTPGIGDAHVHSARAGGPLIIPIYASSDSLIQIALHQSVVSQKSIEDIGIAVRAAVDKAGLRIGRIIMRPFKDGTGENTFDRVSPDRRDYGVDPDGPTLLDILSEAHISINGYGKAASMLNYRGVDKKNIIKLKTDEERMEAIANEWKKGNNYNQFGFDNLIGTDELWGHPRKPREWSNHISMLSNLIAVGMRNMRESDLWIITADHGNDPTQDRHTNHTNEKVPLLVYSPFIKKPVYLGERSSFADVAKTVADNYGVGHMLSEGVSFLETLTRQRRGVE